DAAADEMLLDDPLEDRRIAPAIPRPFGIDEGNRAALADSEAVRFRAQDAALFRQAELLQPPLEEVPGSQTAIFVAALRLRLVATQKNVPPRDRHADDFGLQPLEIRHRPHRDSTRVRARSGAPCSRRAQTQRRRPDWRDTLPRRLPS